MREIPLTKGYVALVDDADFERVNRLKWTATECHRKDGSVKKVYAYRMVGRKTVFLHRFLLGLPPGRKPQVDHHDGDGLNCQRQNLRVASNAENSRNRGKTTFKKSSRFKGVHWHSDCEKW